MAHPCLPRKCFARFRVLVAVTCLAFSSGGKTWADDADKPQRPGDFYEDFRGARAPGAVFRLVGVDHGVRVMPEAGGLRITIPANQARRHRTGLELKTLVTGNFEITAGYEILAGDQPENGYGVGFEMFLYTASPAQDRVGLYRLNRPVEGEAYMLGRGKTENGKPEHKNMCAPTTARSGQLRLTRRGAEVTAWAAEGPGPFQEIRQCDFVAADVTKLSLAAYVGNTEYGVDVRLVDVKVRGDLPDADLPIAPAVDAPAPVQRGGRAWLVWLGLFALLSAAILLLGITMARRRARPIDPPARRDAPGHAEDAGPGRPNPRPRPRPQ